VVAQRVTARLCYSKEVSQAGGSEEICSKNVNHHPYPNRSTASSYASRISSNPLTSVSSRQRDDPCYDTLEFLNGIS